MENDKNKPSTVSEPDFNYTGYTYSDYLKFQIDENVEIIRGKVFRMSPAPGSTHQMVSSKLHVLIGQSLWQKPCKVFSAPYDVILPIHNSIDNATTVVQPDICVICDSNKIKERGCFGAPDWVIEILSPHTSKKDIQLKYEVYEEAGVKEYWVIMPKQQIVEVFVLLEGKYKRHGAYAWEDIVTPYLFPEIDIDLSEVFGEQHEY